MNPTTEHLEVDRAVNTTGNQGLDALADAIAQRVYEKLFQAHERNKSRLLDVRDAAKYVGRTESALRHMIDKRVIASVRSDGRVYLDRSDLDVWIDMGKSRA